MNKTLKITVVAMIAMLLGLLSDGCKTKPPPAPPPPPPPPSNTPAAYTINITLDKMLAGMSLQVELIGTNDTDLPKWESLPPSQYWQPDNVQRRDANKVTFDFGRGNPANVTFSSNNPKWQQWLNAGATSLVIFADLPTLTKDQSGNADPRRLILPLGKRHWGQQNIDILVQESGVRLLTKEASDADNAQSTQAINKQKATDAVKAIKSKANDAKEGVDTANGIKSGLGNLKP